MNLTGSTPGSSSAVVILEIDRNRQFQNQKLYPLKNIKVVIKTLNNNFGCYILMGLQRENNRQYYK